MTTKCFDVLLAVVFNNFNGFFFFFTDFHKVSVYPQKELPFFILFTAALCSISAVLALLTHQFPETMIYAANMVSNYYVMVIYILLS